MSAALCAVLLVASGTVSGASENNSYMMTQEEALHSLRVYGEEEQMTVAASEAETHAAEPETHAKETEAAPAAATVSEPATQASETSAPEMAAPETSAPETSAPETAAPETSAPATEPVTQPAETQTEASTQAPDTSQSSGESESETGALPSETTPETEEQTEASTERSKKKKSKDDIEEAETEAAKNSKYKTNAELLAHQNIVVPPDITLEFRFTQVEAPLAISRSREGIGIYESKSEDARQTGELSYYSYCYILEDKGDGWYYVESGNVRGFVKAEHLVTGDTAQRIWNVKGEENLSTARLMLARTENEAYDYTHTTVQEVIAEPDYALANGTVNIYEQRKESARVTGTLSDQALCYILADADKDWVFVESGNARGFVRKEQLITGKRAEKKVSETGENNMTLATVQIEPEDNKACYYTLTSVQKASQAAYTREAMVNFALQFVGNPYVWGGTSLTNGADCSGFVQSIYAYFGYSLPRVAEDQAGYGMQIPISSAQPGDLIFYAKNGYVYHVSMYIGNGQVVQAANSRVGIITSGIGGDAVWATRIISD
jgi:cell wall-associated NlpC family hydrolase